MSLVRVLVGTKKGGFICTSDEGRKNWTIEGPLFGGWEIYHMKGSPVNPDRIWCSQTSGWFGQLIQRSDDGGETWDTPGSKPGEREQMFGMEMGESNKFIYDGIAGTHKWYDGSDHPWEFKRVWHLEPSLSDPNTVFAKYPPAVPEDDLAYAMLDRLTERTGVAGLQRYEVSAFARPGHRCWHNLNYWQFGDYLGIGAGAHSKLSFAHRTVRQVRYREPLGYMDRALAGQAVTQDDEVARADLPFEFMLNALRLKEGFALQDFTARTGLPVTAIQAALEAAEGKGLIQRDFTHVRPTERGFDFLSDLQALFLPT